MPRKYNKKTKNTHQNTQNKQNTHKITLTLELNGQKFVASGETLEEAILALKDLPTPKTKAIFTLQRENNVSKPVSLFIFQLQRLFGSGLSGEVQRAVLSKRLNMLL